MKINKVIGYCLSSSYGNGKVYGQPLNVKSIGLIEIHTDNGFVGIGETYSGVYVPELIEPTVKFIESLIIGMNPIDIQGVCDSMNIPFVGMNGFIRSVAGAVEIALWDLKGQIEEKPIYKLLSDNYSTDFNIYASGGSVSFNSDDIKKDIEKVTSEGFSSYKMRVGVQDWKQDLIRVSTARSELGTNNLMVDAIMGTLNTWNQNNVVHNIKELEKYDLTWIEEPLHPSKLKELKSIYKMINIPIATGEGLSGKFDFDSYLDSNCIDIIQPDVTYCGGFIQAIRIIENAKRRGIKVALHVWGSSISLISNLHLALAMKVDWIEIPMVKLDLLSSEFNNLKEIILNKHFLPNNGLGIKISDDIKNTYQFINNSGYKIKK
ncbi:hypothetical protein CL614_08275 [archaeon]|nr:hypothetical protein [archaeon]|tara:strand:+ start:1461 stop:2591 length:1131 start_codon:yes stop_codon:yes gene_type:complete